MAFADFGKYSLTTSYTLVIRYIMNIKTTYCYPWVGLGEGGVGCS